MTKFNVGDVVYWVGGDYPYFKVYDGDILTITEILPFDGDARLDLYYFAVCIGGWYSSRFKLVEAAKPKSKFKVGDKVKIIGYTGGGSEHFHPINSVGVVTSPDGSDCPRVEVDGISQSIREVDLELYVEEEVKEITPSTKGTSDGGPSEYYDFPEECKTLNDLIEYKNMSFAHGNIFKAAYRLGHKDGITLEYDLNKIIYYAERMLNQLKEVK